MTNTTTHRPAHAEEEARSVHASDANDNVTTKFIEGETQLETGLRLMREQRSLLDRLAQH